MSMHGLTLQKVDAARQGSSLDVLLLACAEQGGGAGVPQAHRDAAQGAAREEIGIPGKEARCAPGVPGIPRAVSSI